MAPAMKKRPRRPNDAPIHAIVSMLRLALMGYWTARTAEAHIERLLDRVHKEKRCLGGVSSCANRNQAAEFSMPNEDSSPGV